MPSKEPVTHPVFDRKSFHSEMGARQLRVTFSGDSMRDVKLDPVAYPNDDSTLNDRHH